MGIRPSHSELGELHFTHSLHPTFTTYALNNQLACILNKGDCNVVGPREVSEIFILTLITGQEEWSLMVIPLRCRRALAIALKL